MEEILRPKSGSWNPCEYYARRPLNASPNNRFLAGASTGFALERRARLALQLLFDKALQIGTRFSIASGLLHPQKDNKCIGIRINPSPVNVI